MRLGDAVPPVLGSEISMAADSFDDGPEPSAPANGEGVIHNSVLIRTREPARETHPWAAPAVLGVAVVVATVIWGVMATHPSGPVENHAVAAAPTTFVPAKTS
jgi:hypothetical protein